MSKESIRLQLPIMFASQTQPTNWFGKKQKLKPKLVLRKMLEAKEPKAKEPKAKIHVWTAVSSFSTVPIEAAAATATATTNTTETSTISRIRTVLRIVEIGILDNYITIFEWSALLVAAGYGDDTERWKKAQLSFKNKCLGNEHLALNASDYQGFFKNHEDEKEDIIKADDMRLAQLYDRIDDAVGCKNTIQKDQDMDPQKATALIRDCDETIRNLKRQLEIYGA